MNENIPQTSFSGLLHKAVYFGRSGSLTILINGASMSAGNGKCSVFHFSTSKSAASVANFVQYWLMTSFKTIQHKFKQYSFNTWFDHAQSYATVSIGRPTLWLAHCHVDNAEHPRGKFRLSWLEQYR